MSVSWHHSLVTITETGIVMGILLITLRLSSVLGCITWLLIGDQLTLKSEHKWESRMNITIYIGTFLVPIYLLIFALF